MKKMEDLSGGMLYLRKSGGSEVEVDLRELRELAHCRKFVRSFKIKRKRLAMSGVMDNRRIFQRTSSGNILAAPIAGKKC